MEYAEQANDQTTRRPKPTRWTQAHTTLPSQYDTEWLDPIQLNQIKTDLAQIHQIQMQLNNTINYKQTKSTNLQKH